MTDVQQERNEEIIRELRDLAQVNERLQNLELTIHQIARILCIPDNVNRPNRLEETNRRKNSLNFSIKTEAGEIVTDEKVFLIVFLSKASFVGLREHAKIFTRQRIKRI